MRTCDVTKLEDRISQEYGLAKEDAHNKGVPCSIVPECAGMVRGTGIDRHLCREVFTADASGNLEQ